MSSSILLVNPVEIPSAIGSPAALERPRPSAFGGPSTGSHGLIGHIVGNPGLTSQKKLKRQMWPQLQSWTGAWHKKRGTNMALNEPQKMASLPTEKLVGDKYTQPARRVASNLGSLSHFVHSAIIFSAPFIWEHEMGLYPSCICRFAILYIKV